MQQAGLLLRLLNLCGRRGALILFGEPCPDFFDKVSTAHPNDAQQSLRSIQKSNSLEMC
jgi:hypothetical protein